MPSAHVLCQCQVRPASVTVPATGSPEAVTVTFVTRPAVAVTVMPREGLTPWLPLAGVIFSSVPGGVACAVAEAGELT